MDWFADSHNPSSEYHIPRWAVLIRFLIAVPVVVAVAVYVMPWLLNESGIEPWAIWLLLAAYLLLGYFVRPHVDSGELEWWQLFIDIPFYYQDDIDRFTLFLTIILTIIILPARFVTHAIVDFAVLLLHALG